jgi:hypothetical protein
MWKRSSRDHAPSGGRTPLRGLAAVPIVAVLLMALMPSGLASAAPSGDTPTDPCAAAAQRGSPGDCPDPSTPTPSGSSNNNSSNNGGKNNGGKNNDPPFFCIHSNSRNSDSNSGCKGEEHKEGSSENPKGHPKHDGAISRGVEDIERTYLVPSCDPKKAKHLADCESAREKLLEKFHEVLGVLLICRVIPGGDAVCTYIGAALGQKSSNELDQALKEYVRNN